MSKFVDSILGHAVGDAMGVPTEFRLREQLLKKPVTKMVEFTRMGLPKGTWSDDTSMEIATIDSFIQNNRFDYDDIMRRWVDWVNKSDYTATGITFDVGRTCLRAITRYTEGVKALECGANSLDTNGNGSLMRILPIALYSYYKKLNNESIINLVNDISSLTHAHDISKLGCYIYVKYISYLLYGLSKEDAYRCIQREDYSSYSEEAINMYKRILKDNIKDYSVRDIRSSGYIVDTLECSLWIIMNARDFKEAIIASTNIGGDTDTIGAVTGSIAGIIYGYDSIPKDWLEDLQRRDYLIDLALEYEKKTCI